MTANAPTLERSSSAHPTAAPGSVLARTGRSRPSARLLLVRAVAVLTVAGLLAACGGSDEPEAAPASPVASASPDAPPPPPPPPPVSPLTGVAPAPVGPLLAVKIDNGVLARPFHRGLEKATVMYQELAEGGSTRFLGIYDRSIDTEIGPIRSVRESDVELIAQYGKVAFAFSGGQGGVLAVVAKARDAGAVLDVSYDVRPELYRLAERRRDARNFYAVPAKLATANPGDVPVKDIGWTFGPPPAAGAPVAGGRLVFSEISTVGVRWNAPTARWAISQDGKEMPAVAPVNVILQQVPVRGSSFRDVKGLVSPFTPSVGQGPVSVLRDGKRIDGTWMRPNAASGTRFLDAAGADIPLTPGGATWVMLVPTGVTLNAG